MTPRIKNCVERARCYQDQILLEISKHQTADGSDRSVVATVAIKMAAGDFKAILTEIDNDNPGPAFKLFRLLYEDVVNALWAQAFATAELIGKLLHTDHGQLPGSMAERAEKLDTIFVAPSDVATDDDDTLFVHLQSKFWKTANSFTHGGSLAINRELAGYDEESTYQMLRSSMTLFLILIDAMYRLHYCKPNDVLSGIAQTYFAEKW
jgi:Family of unknown function (DUF6988)